MLRLQRASLLLRTRGGWTLALHGSLPIGLLVFSGLKPSLGFIAAYAFLLGLHNWGHTRRVRTSGQEPELVVCNALGGRCLFGGITTARQSRFIALGGIMAQAWVAVGAFITATLWAPTEGFWAELLGTLTYTNALLIILNLLPLPGADGYQLWSVSERIHRMRPPSSGEGRRERVHKAVNLDVNGVALRRATEEQDATADVIAQLFEISDRVNRDRQSLPSDEN